MDDGQKNNQVQSYYNVSLGEKEEELGWYAREIKREERKRRLLLVVLTVFIFFLSLSAVWGVYLVSQTTRVKSKAYETSSKRIELSNSYLFASPLKARVGGERIRITVFILDGQGLGVSGKRVILKGEGRLQIEDIQNITDDLGKAVFEVYSNVAGVYQLEAAVEGRTLPQKVSVTFE